MIKFLCLLVLLMGATNLFSANRYWVSNSSSNWNNTNNWSTSSGGTGGASIPTSGDFVYFNNNGTGNCTLDINAAFDGISINGYNGIIDINGFAFNASVSGTSNSTFASGTINDTPGTSEIAHTSTGLTRFSGTTFGASINVISNQVDFEGGIFNAPVIIENNNSGSVNGSGNCTFNASFKATNSGTGYFLMGQYNADVFNGPVTLINTSTSRIRIAYGGSGHQFNDDITVENTGGGIWFGENSGASTLANSKSINIGTTGFSSGELRIENLTQLGTNAQNLTLTGTARLTIIDGTTFNANVQFSAPQLVIQYANFNGVANLTKTGASNNQSAGGNNFAQDVTLNNSGTGYLLFGNGNPDIFGGNLTLNNTGQSHIYIAYNGAGNTISGDLNITNGATGIGGNINISSASASTLSILGDVILSHEAPGTNSRSSIGQSGSVNIGGDLEITNTAGGTNSHIYIGDDDTVSIAGALTISNAPTSTNTYLYIADGINSSVTIGDSLYLSNNSTGNVSRLYIANSGHVNLTGNFNLTNAAVSNAQFILGRVASATMTIDGDASINNLGSGTTSTIYLGSNGDLTFNGDLSIYNASTANDSRIFCHNSDDADNTYNGDIILESTSANSDGILFGSSNGRGTLANTKTISIGPNGFIAGQLYLRNFTQIGNAPQTLIGTGTTYLSVYTSDWGGNIEFRSPRIYTNHSRYRGTTILEKTGGTNTDNSVGGNVFDDDLLLINSGSYGMGFGVTAPDTCKANLTVQNTGSGPFIWAYNSIGNVISGDLNITNTTTGNNPYVYFGYTGSPTLTVNGNVTATNNGTATTNHMYIGNAGSLTINGNLTGINNNNGTNGNLYLANSANAIINGNCTLTNMGTANSSIAMANNTAASLQISGITKIVNTDSANYKRIYLGNSGDVILNDSLYITNASHAHHSEVYCNNYSNSNGQYNESIVLETTVANSDGILFGSSSGTSTLAASKTISIGSNGFVSGRLLLRNFTQTGATDQYLTCSGTCLLYNYDSNWGGNIDFRSPRIISRGSQYDGTARLEKTGAYGDGSYGGNTFTGDLEMINSGSGDFNMGYYTPDSCLANLNILNSGSEDITYAYNSTGGYIAGDVSIINNGNGVNNYAYLGYSGTPTVTVGGNIMATNSGSASNNNNIYLGNSGTLSVAGDVTINNIVTGTNGNVYLGNSAQVDIMGNCSLTNSGTSNANLIVSNGSSANVTIHGNMSILNENTSTNKYTYLGNYGDITVQGTLDIVNSSTATNALVYCNNYGNSHGSYHDNITLSSTNSSDGIYFGRSSGTSTLSAGKTVSVGAGGYTSGILQFRNFTQTGATDQSLTLTGTGYLYNYNAEWGGNVDFRAPRHYTRGTHYHGTAYLEKTGGIGDDNSAGGNTFAGTTDLVNSGSTQMLMGSSQADTFMVDLNITNSGTDHFYLAYNSSNNYIAGDLTITQSNTGTYGILSIANQSGASLIVDGKTNYNLTANANDARFYIGNSGDITFNDNVDITVNSAANYNYGYLASGTNSLVTINGDLNVTSNGIGINKRIYISNSGDLDLAGDLTITNNNNATNGTISLGEGTNSNVNINGKAEINNMGMGNEKRVYLGQNGDITFSDSLIIKNAAGANSSHVYCNNTSNSVNQYLGDITVENTNANGDGVYFGNSNGNGTLANGQTITISSGGFGNGQLVFRNFTQLGNVPQTLLTNGSTTLNIRDSEWHGNIDFTSPRLYTRGTLYNGTSSLEKTGSGNDASLGGNTFNDTAYLTNSGTGYLMPANSISNDFNAPVTYSKNSTGLVYPSYNCESTYNADITINASTIISFGAAGNGRVSLDGTAAQNIYSNDPNIVHTMRDIHTNNNNDDITLHTPIRILSELDLDFGNIITSTVNTIIMNDNSTVSSVSDDAYVEGPLEKTGNDIFTFPVGKSGVYRPIELSSAPSSSSARFKAEFFDTDPVDDGYLDYQIPSTINHISDCEYWILDRTNSNNNVNVKLYYKDYSGNNCSGVLVPSELAVVRWDGTTWVDHGNGGIGGTASDGWVETAGVVTAFSPFTLASTTINNPLPIELLFFEATAKIDHVVLDWETASEQNNAYFEVEKSNNGQDFVMIDKQEGAINSSSNLHYSTIDHSPSTGLNYYRLKQVDLNGDFTYSTIKTVHFNLTPSISLSPNPTSGMFSISGISIQDIDRVIVLDDKGKQVQFFDQLEQNSLDLSYLSTGMYFIQIIHHSNLTVLPLIKL